MSEQLGTCYEEDGDVPHAKHKRCINWVHVVSDPAPVEGVVLLDLSDSDNFYLRLSNKEIALLRTQLAEAIAQRDEARKQLASWGESYDQAVADQGVLLERAEKVESALATERAQGREEGLREAYGVAYVNMKQKLSALISKK